MSDAWPPRPPTSWPTPPSPPTPSPTPPASRGRIVAGAIVGVAIVVIVAIVAAFAITDEDEPSGAFAVPSTTGVSGSQSTEPPAPGATTTAPPTDLDAAVDDAIKFIESERHRKFTTRPPVEALDDAAFVARYSALLDEAVKEDPHAAETSTVILRAFGFIAPDQDAIEVERSFGAAGVLGFYDDEKNELVVRGTNITPYFRTTLVHELTHALDDQLVELHRPQYDEADDEIAFGLSVVAEGNARRVENAFRDTLSDEEQRDAQREESSAAGAFDVGDFQKSYLVLQLAPYQLGEVFVGELLDHGGEDAVDDALRNPPTTSEQVFNFDDYLDHRAAEDVPHPAADPGGTVVEDGVFGQLPILAMLTGAVGPVQAANAADGWGGDWYVAWTQGTASCARTTIKMDSDKDAGELRTALDAWAKKQSGTPTVTSDGETVGFTSCAG